MMRNRKLSLKRVVESRADASGQLHSPGDAVLIKRGSPRWLLLKCPCGCGEQIPVNLDARAGKAWRLYRNKTGLTLFPSVWRDTGCEAHFIIWRDQIVTFGGGQASNNSPALTLDVSDLAKRTLAAWPPGDFVSYV